MVGISSMNRYVLGLLLLAALVAAIALPGVAASTIVFWSHHGFEDEPILREIVEEFQAAHPDIIVDWQNQLDEVGGVDYYTQLSVAILGGVGPDVFYVRPGTDYPFVKTGWIYDIDELVHRDADEIGIDDFIPAQVGELTHDGKWWALPYDFSAPALYFNQDLFDEAGVAYPEPGWTWDDLIEAARMLTRRDGDVTRQWGMHGLGWFFNQFSEGFYMSFGGRLFDESYSASAVNEPATVDALGFPVRLIHELQVAAPMEFPGYSGLFSTQQAAMTIDGSWATAGHRARNDFRFDVSSLPFGPAGLTVSATGGAWAMAADTDAPDAAWELMKALASRESSRKLIVEPARSLPPAVSLMPEWADAVQRAGAPENSLRIAEQVVEYGRAIPRVGFRFDQALHRHHHGLVVGPAMSPQETAELIHHEFQVEFDRLSD